MRKMSLPLLMTLALLLAACVPVPTEPTVVPVASTSKASDLATTAEEASIANPASTYCESKGGEVDIRQAASGGEVGFCVFTDNTECEEWDLYTGSCVQGGGEVPTDTLATLASQTLPDLAFHNGGIEISQLAVGEAAPLWLVHSYGIRNYEVAPLPSHLVALYSRAGDEWLELAHLDLDQAAPNEGFLAPDYMNAGDVTQAMIEPTHIWLDVRGGGNGYMGVFYLLSFDGEDLDVEIARNSSSPGVSIYEDLDGDAMPELLLDASDPYVFCHACGVRNVAIDIFRYDATSQHVVEVQLQRMPEGDERFAGAEKVNRAVALAEAGLWKQALAEIEDAQMQTTTSKAVFDTGPMQWDEILLRVNAEAMKAAVADSVSPLLSNIYYGDYGAALDLMRPYSPAELFATESLLLNNTVAMGSLPLTTKYITESTTSALTVEPDMAEALFLRAWAEYIANPADPQTTIDLTEAASLAPKDELITESAAFLFSH